MRIILIQPRRSEGKGFRGISQVEPLGLEMIAGALREENHQVKILDLMSKKQILKNTASFKPDLCGISCSFTVDTHYTIELSKQIKESFPNIFLFIGGHHATSSPQDFNSPYIDAVICGEGEETIKNLAACCEEGGNLHEVKGLILNYEEKQHYTGEQKLIDNLDSLPYPAIDLVKKYREKYFHGLRKPLYSLETARGCTFKCKFCSVWKFYKSKYRMKSAERTVEEIAQIPGTEIFVTDDNFLSHTSRARKIAELLEKKKIKKSFIVQARSDDIVSNPQLIDMWQKVGLTSVFIGFEDIAQENLDEHNKKNSTKNNEAALKILQNKNINVISSFIISPQFNLSDFKKMISYVNSKGIKIPSYSILTPLPGTVLYEEMKKNITTYDYRLFDLMHAVLPTKLPLEDFYQEFAELWAKTYNYKHLVSFGIIDYLKYIVRRPFDIPHLIKMLRSLQCLFDKDAYLVDHKTKDDRFKA